MNYIDYDRLEGLDTVEYRNQDPYPWANPEGILTQEGFDILRGDLPDVSIFEKAFGAPRRAGQAPHDRFTLEFTSSTPVYGPWKEFIAELSADRYRSTLCRLLGVQGLDLNFHWHYTPNGCSVSPHCDAKRKLGSHIFYLNTDEDWKAEWGGETVVLDDNGRFDTNSAPEFEDFDRALSSETMGNRSFIFSRQGNSWHGVREINCPEGYMRKVFIVVLNRRKSTWSRWRAKWRPGAVQRF
jgi:hypothetical protein